MLFMINGPTKDGDTVSRETFRTADVREPASESGLGTSTSPGTEDTGNLSYVLRSSVVVFPNYIVRERENEKVVVNPAFDHPELLEPR